MAQFGPRAFGPQNESAGQAPAGVGCSCEYEFYPDGDWRYNPVADRWAMRVGSWVKQVAQHGHIVAVHNGPREPAFADRFAAHPESIDAIMFQHWGTRGEQDGWLAAGIEEQIRDSLAGWPGSAVFAEYGYEHNPELPLLIPSHHYCDGEHTWRGAWRGAFCALGIIHGFDNSWGPFQVLDQDQPGLIYLLHLRRFFTEIVPFHRMRPAPEAIVPEEHSSGQVPLALATPEGDVVAVYLPVGGIARLSLPVEGDYCARRYDPRSGELLPASVLANVTTGNFAAPGSEDGTGHPWDWVLLLTARRVCG